ncbi:MAG TPA: hypothetical protein VHO90_19870 [Bacteroidales bacterium]|nr:hypothetical protein [Bacteroidales bacterium]
MKNFAKNPMLSATKNSNAKALKISTYHVNALSAEKDDPYIVTLLTPYLVVHNELKAAMEAQAVKGGQRQGKTVTLYELLGTLSNTKISRWQAAVAAKYGKAGEEYTTFFPEGSKPFQNGAQLDRVRAVEALSSALTGYTALADLKTEVDAFKTLLRTAYDTQKEHIGSTKEKSDEIKPFRDTMCNLQYGDLGLLMNHYASAPENILRYFDLSVLSRTEQTKFTGQLKPGEIYTIAKRTFAAGDEIKINNKGNVALKFYLGKKREIPPTVQGITVAPGEQTIEVSSLGNLADKYLIVQNPDTIQEGSFEIEIL